MKDALDHSEAVVIKSDTGFLSWFIPELGILIRLAVPVSLASAGMSIMSAFSSAIVGRIDSLNLAAYGLSNIIFSILSIIAIGIVMGFDPMISQAVGAKKQDRARNLLWQGVRLSLATGFIAMLFMAVFPFFQEMLGISPDIARLVRRSIWVRIPCIPFMLVMYIQRSYLMSLGKTFPLVIAIISSNILNMALCPILILGGKNLPTNISLEIIPPMGAIGASLSNCLSIILVTFILAVFIKRISVRKNGFSHSPIKREMLTALKIGFPIGMQLFAETGVFTIIGFLAGQFGKTGLAANQIALTYSSLMFTLALGIGSAAAVRVGLAVGAANSSQAKKSGLTSLGLGALITIILSFIFIFFPEFLSKIMTDKTEVISASIPLIKIVGIFLIFDGLQGISTGILRGMGDTKYTFVVGMLCHYLVGIPIAFVAGIFLKGGIAYLWGGLCIGLVAIFILLCFRFFKMSSREIARIE